jgi:hypothetical protein
MLRGKGNSLFNFSQELCAQSLTLLLVSPRRFRDMAAHRLREYDWKRH